MDVNNQSHYAALSINPRENKLLNALNVDVQSFETEDPGRHWRVKLANFHAPPESRQVIATLESKEQLDVIARVHDGWLELWVADRLGELRQPETGLIVVRVERLIWD